MKYRRKHKPQRHELKIKRRTKPGSSPGQIAPDPSQPKPVLQVLAYGKGIVVEKEVHDLQELPKLLSSHEVTWINVDGLGDVKTRSREAWVIDAARYLHHPLRAGSSRRYVRPALELLHRW